MSMKLYVGNLAFETTGDDLKTLFAEAGTVESVSLIEDRETGRSRGFGFVEMQTKEEGTAAVEKFNGTEFAGRPLKVNEAKPRENRTSDMRRRFGLLSSGLLLSPSLRRDLSAGGFLILCIVTDRSGRYRSRF